MDAADSSSTSSKVIVQCTDPYDLFDKISSGLESRLPLGNLHWKSPTRPLRSIDKLNVSFTREAKQTDVASGIRRHQIPGLRQTPYVKLLLLRCDDRDNYKDSTRKEVKEWLKRAGVSQDGKPLVKGQDRHDAFEYIIVHVVVPGTPAAAQPKSVKQITQEASDSTDSLNNKSKWTGKNATTVYDKLRADFGIVSKGSFERVAQIRITDGSVPASPIRPSDLEELWQDLMEKLKAAILQSFDARVLQYEEDIKDRESQRSLPGWNFCTFFILKEGLARGFENVGLIEDALTVYDELDAGLDKIVQDQAASNEADTTGSLLPFSQDLKPAIRKAIEPSEDTKSSNASLSVPSDLDALIDLEKKSVPLDENAIDYQQRILTNQVSALDLRLYMYTRKVRLLFRRARNAVQQSKMKLGGSQYDIGKLSEICARALEFISFASRALRHDLYAAWGGQHSLDDQELRTQELVIGNMVASWKVSAILQLLEECQISVILSDILAPAEVPTKATRDTAKNEERPIPPPLLTKHPLHRQVYLQSPLDHRQSTIIPLMPSPQPQREAPHVDSRERLALWVAELLVALRDIVKSISPDVIKPDRLASMDGECEGSTTKEIRHKASGIRSATLKTTSVSSEAAIALYETLTTYAYRCYKFANQMQASRHMVLSLAQMEYDRGLTDGAIEWLERIPDLLDLEAKTSTDLAIFRLYLRCLDSEARPNEYARCSMAILQFSKTTLGSLAVRRARIDLQDILDRLVAVSKNTENYDLPFLSLFNMGAVARSISHVPQQDGFELSLTLALCYDLTIRVDDEMVLTLQSTANPDAQPIHLTSRSPVSLNATTATAIQFVSRTAASGWFVPSYLHIRLGNLHFVYSFPSTKDSPSAGDTISSLTTIPIMVYPRTDSFSIRSSAATTVDLTLPARISVCAMSGDADIGDVMIRIKPATGGFRLNLHATEMKTDDQVEGFQTVPSDGSLAFSVARLPQRQKLYLEIPYSLENNFLSVVQVRVETVYKIGDQVFNMASDEQISIFLPIVVNVQDIFQADATTLRFSAGPAAKNPVRIRGWKIEDTPAFTVTQSSVPHQAINAFSKLPVSWIIRVKPSGDVAKDHRKLKLTVDYECADELILRTLTTTFRRALETTEFVHLQALFQTHLTTRMSKSWTDVILENAALTQEFRPATFDEMQWHEVMSAVEQSLRSPVETWLRLWHADHEMIDISAQTPTVRSLKLLVDIPQPDLLVQSNMKVKMASPSTYLTAGQPVHATLTIACQNPIQPGVELHYEVSAPTELWLIGGRKRGSFQPPKREQQVSIMLIPQKPGHILLPAVEIRGRLQDANGPQTSFSCEVENQNQAQSVLVVPGLHTTTVAAGQNIDPRFPRLLVSHSR